MKKDFFTVAYFIYVGIALYLCMYLFGKLLEYIKELAK